VANSLSPVKPLKVELRESDHTAIVTVLERQLSLAIGKDGQNARLAAKLSGWRVDVVKPAEGEVFEDRLDQFQEPVASQTSRRDRGDRSQGRHDRYDRGGEGGGGGSRRSGHQRDRGGHRHNSSYGYDTDRE
jgi:N utilization substance protein A